MDPQLTDRELTELMFDWQDAQARATRLKILIEAEVMRREKTFVAGAVAVSYTKGRSNFLWQDSAIKKGFTDEQKADFSTTTTEVKIATDWKALAENRGITKESCERSTPKPKATLKLK